MTVENPFLPYIGVKWGFCIYFNESKEKLEMNEEHYLSKIERNTIVLDKVPEGELKANCIRNITWARTVVSKLESLDYNERQSAIVMLHKVLDEDYQKMGFSNEEDLVEEVSRGMN